jgi:Putative polyhydroxyalkanoic acid system protein (PHA_gran_rgn)
MTVQQTPFRPLTRPRAIDARGAATICSGTVAGRHNVKAFGRHLGRDEALRRLKNGLGSASANYGHVLKFQEEIWTGPHLQYRISALGQVASGSIDVAEDHVRLEVFLPWLLAKLAETLQPLIRKEGTLLLEKK